MMGRCGPKRGGIRTTRGPLYLLGGPEICPDSLSVAALTAGLAAPWAPCPLLGSLSPPVPQTHPPCAAKRGLLAGILKSHRTPRCSRIKSKLTDMASGDPPSAPWLMPVPLTRPHPFFLSAPPSRIHPCLAGVILSLLSHVCTCCPPVGRNIPPPQLAPLLLLQPGHSCSS